MKKIYIIKIIIYISIFILALGFYTIYNSLCINNILNKDIYYKTIRTASEFYISVGGEEDKKDYEKVLQDDIKRVSKIPHVIEVYNADYNSFSVESSFGYDVDLHRGSANTLPKITFGRSFKDNEKNVAICPNTMYLSKDNKGKSINGKDILNKHLIVYYYDYIKDEYQQMQKNNEYQKDFEVIGLYDNTKLMDSDNICYISHNDIKDIVDKSINLDINSSNPLAIIVDKYQNIKDVKNSLEDIGISNVIVPTYEESIYVRKIRVKSLILTSLSVVLILIILNFLFKKYYNRIETN